MREYAGCDSVKEKCDPAIGVPFRIWYAGWWGTGMVVYVDDSFTKEDYEWQWLVDGW